MIYGLYLSATGVMTNSHRQDVISNNLANSQTVGFKRSLALFQERPTEASASGSIDASNPMLDKIGGGMLLSPTYVDHSQGPLEQTGNNLDVGIHGKGYFAVQDGSDTRLTRDGRFMVDRQGFLILADGADHHVLDSNSKPIRVGENVPQSTLLVDKDGTLTAGDQTVARIGLFNVADTSQLRQLGGSLLSHPEASKLPQADGTMQGGYIEDSNVDPTTELTQLINAQRQLEANANMIRYQDQTLQRLVNEVGKIG